MERQIIHHLPQAGWFPASLQENHAKISPLCFITEHDMTWNIPFVS